MESLDYTRLDSREGVELFQQSVDPIGGLRLLSALVTQDTLTFCGPATVTTVLNAIGVPRPVAEGYGSYRLFTQGSVFDGTLPTAVGRETVEASGATLEQLGQWLVSGQTRIVVRFAEQVDPHTFRSDLTEPSANAGRAVVVNYFRPRLSQKGGGHISPVGAYHKEKDLVLILDVARYRFPPHWVPAELLFDAMREVDAGSGRSRGYVVIDRSGDPSLGTSEQPARPR